MSEAVVAVATVNSSSTQLRHRLGEFLAPTGGARLADGSLPRTRTTAGSHVFRPGAKRRASRPPPPLAPPALSPLPQASIAPGEGSEDAELQRWLAAGPSPETRQSSVRACTRALQGACGTVTAPLQPRTGPVPALSMLTGLTAASAVP